MAKNLIPEIAKMLGVELGEEFKIKELVGLAYKFDDKGLRLIYDNHMAIFVTDASATTVVGLLNGEYEIEKLPWRPKEGDTFFSFELFGGKWVICSSQWGESPSAYALLEKGWVYRTCEEAQAALPAVAKEIGVEYEL